MAGPSSRCEMPEDQQIKGAGDGADCGLGLEIM